MSEPVSMIEDDLSRVPIESAHKRGKLAEAVAGIFALAPSRVLILGIVLLVTASYANSLSGGFVYDDKRVVLANPLLGHWSLGTLKLIFTSDYWAAYNPEQAGEVADSLYYRPFYHLFAMMSYSVAGTSSVMWHLLSVLLHAGAAALVFLALERSVAAASSMEGRKRRIVCASAAAIFAIHPIQSEAVAWISASANSLLTILVLGAFVFYLRYRERKRAVSLAAAISLFAMASLTKETAVSLAVVIAAYEFFIFNRERAALARVRLAVVRILPFLLVTIGYFAVRYSVMRIVFGQDRNFNFPEDASLTFADNLRTLPALIGAYLKQVVFPFDLSMMYDFGYVRSIGFQSFWLPLVIALTASALLLYLSWRSIEVRLAVIWMVIPLLPHLNTRVFPSEELIHDRYLYMSMMGVGLLVATLVMRAWQIPRLRLTRRSIACASALIITAMCLKTAAQNRQWLNEEGLWAWSAEHAPNSRVVRLALGALAENRRDAEGALREYEAALQINPDIIDALNNAAFVYARSGRWQEATRKFERIVSLTPDKAIAHFNLSFAYAVLKRYAEAAREQKSALDLDPEGPRAEEWRARLEQLSGQTHGGAKE